jgi:ubiquinone/menaquinone biosynthesis C-methylase UbiE
MALVVSRNVEKYEDIYKQGHDKSYPTLDLVRLEGWYFKNQPGVALDYAFGTGVNMIHLLKRGYTVTGIEAAPQAINIARRKLDAMPEIAGRATLKLIETDADRLPLADASFDYVVCMSVLSLLESKDRIHKLLAEFQRILKPGGKMVIDVNGPEGDFALKGRFIGDDIYEYTLREHHKEGVLCYCPKSKEAFGKLFGPGWIIDDLGMVAFEYMGCNELEFIACVRKD